MSKLNSRASDDMFRESIGREYFAKKGWEPYLEFLRAYAEIRGWFNDNNSKEQATEFIHNELQLQYPGDYVVELIETHSAESDSLYYKIDLKFNSNEEKLMWVLRWT